MVRSQNDLYMVNLNAEGNSNHDNLMTSLGTEKLTLAELQRAAVNILRVILDLPVMEPDAATDDSAGAKQCPSAEFGEIKSRVIID